MTTNYPKISIITPVFNAEKTIKQTIESVLNQDYPDVEYIIIDGASSDNTLAVISNFNAENLTVISEKDNGIYDAMNKGLKQATGEITAILNADDYYVNHNVLSKIAAVFNNTNADIVYGKMQTLKEINGKQFFRTDTPNIELMPKTMGIFHPATFVKKQVYETLGYFNTHYRLAADYDFLLRAFNNNCKFEYINDVLTVFRTGGQSNLSCLSYKEAVDILQNNNSPYVNEMKALYRKCLLKNSLKSAALGIISAFKLHKIKNKLTENKWQSKNV